jgi:hypothetical protein
MDLQLFPYQKHLGNWLSGKSKFNQTIMKPGIIMKNILIVLISCCLSVFSGYSQSKNYVVPGVEMIFSFANIKDQGISETSTMRWAPVLNVESVLHRDINPHLGLFTGIAIRNVGYIYDNYTYPDEEQVYKKKFRSYNLGIPLGVKFGDLDKLFFFAGYEIELPFIYKEKTFENDSKETTISGWFSSRQNLFQHGLMGGVQFPHGLGVKFKYYLSEFHNQDYSDPAGIQPYSGLDSHIFYVSINFKLFFNKKYYNPLIPGNKTTTAFTN